MKSYLVTMTPLEPYFFGNEKTFAFKGTEKSAKNKYLIKSEEKPSQSTILGTLRYLLMPVKKSDWSYNDDEKRKNAQAVGENGFVPYGENDFGKIKKISPVFLYKDGEYLVQCPFDHIVSDEEGNLNKYYTPFSEYEETLDKNKKYAKDFVAKNDLADSFLRLSDKAIIPKKEAIINDERVGINRRQEKEGFFKKEYCMLNGGYSFAFYAELDDDIQPENTIAFCGQGKSAFSVVFTPEENTVEEKLKKWLRDDVVYIWGDTFITSDIYDKCLFAATKTKTYRHYKKEKGRVSKDGILYNLLASGSILMPREEADVINDIEKENFVKTGYNKAIIKNRG